MSNIPEDLKKFLKEQEQTREYFAQTWYEESIRPESWAAQADLLKRAAEVLWAAFYQDHQKLMERLNRAMPDPATIDTTDLRNLHIFHIYLLIAGYAIENLLKGIIVKKNLIPSLHQPRPELPTKLPSYLNSHNLMDLLQQAGLRCKSDDEREFLRVLSDYTTWAGRYPAPKHWKDLRPGEYPAIHYEPLCVHNMFTTLFERWFKHL